MDEHGTLQRLGVFFTRLAAQGDRPQDSDEEKLRRHYLVYLGLMMSGGALLWGVVAALLRLWDPSAIALGYLLISALNFAHFRQTKAFGRARFLQMLCSLALPFAFQWSLGGFAASGAVMLWSLVALLGSLAFLRLREAAAWLGVYLVLVGVSAVLDDTSQHVLWAASPRSTSVLFAVNIGLVSTLMFGLTAYLLTQREAASTRIAEMTQVLKKMFGRYLSTEVMNSIIANPSALELGGERRQVTIMMTDLRGFTAVSERLEPEQVVQMLNGYFEVMVNLVLKHGGTINEIIGDALLVIFGAPQEMPDRARRAIACAIEMQNAMAEVNAENLKKGLPQLQMGIGLNESDVIVGNIGSSRRSKYAVVGKGVNMASRIESYAVGGDVLISQSVRDAAGEGLRLDGVREVRPKGAEAAVKIYEVGGISAPYDLVLRGKEPPLVALAREIPFSVALLHGKDVGPQHRAGAILRLSRHTAEVRLDVAPEPLSNLKLNLGGVDEALAQRDFYGKVTRVEPGNDRLCLVHFTALPPEVDAYFQALLHYAGLARAA